MNPEGEKSADKALAVPDVEIDLRCSETLSDFEDDDPRDCLYVDDVCPFRDLQDRKLSCLSSLMWCTDDDDETTDGSQEVELVKIKPRAKRSTNANGESTDEVADKSKAETPAVHGGETGKSEAEDNATASVPVEENSSQDEDDGSAVLSQLSLRDDELEPSQPEGLFDSCYVGDHVVPLLEE